MNKKNLLFLGDSITAGVLSGPELDYRKKGYSKFIAQYFKQKGKLGNHHNFAVSGFMTKNILEQLKSNITHNENIAFNILSEKCYRLTKKKVGKDTIKFTHPDIHILDAIKEADMLVITIGANDLIKLFEKAQDIGATKLIQAIVNKSYIEISRQEALANYKKIINIILNQNPTIELILMGTYVPFNEEKIVNILYEKFCLLEDSLYDELKNEFGSKIKIVKPRNSFKANKDKYIQSKFDIHPSTKGHKALANHILKEQRQISYIDNEVLDYEQTKI